MQPSDRFEASADAAEAEALDIDGLVRKFQKELNSGLIALVLLSVFERADEDLYGYQIAKRLEGMSESGSPMKQGALYPVLRTLSAHGLLASRVVPSYSGPPRRYYKITASGRETLARWLAAWRMTRDFVDTAAEASAAPYPSTPK